MAVSNFKPIKDYFPGIANMGILAEKSIYTDSNNTLIKCGMLGESIVTMLGDIEGIEFYENTFKKMINTLSNKGILDEPYITDLHYLRTKRNDAAHGFYESEDDAKTAVEIAYSVCGWFVELYGKDGYKYEHKPFVLPKKGEPITEEADEKEQSKLDKQDKDTAKGTSSKEIKENKKKAKAKKYSHDMSEAETRVLIDQQLRQVGWEADTINLRYSKGTLPEKGKNMAIAEWPTDSTVSSKGYADYALFIGLKMVGIIEAKAVHKDISSVVDYQGKDYAKNIRKEDEQYVDKMYGQYKVPFIFATNGRPYIEQFKTKSGIWMLDVRENTNAPYALAGWMSPLGIEERLNKDADGSNAALKNEPYDILMDKDGLGLYEHQIKAVKAAEKALVDDGAKAALIAMATGTGKTRTVLGLIYRFLKTNAFKRILFLVDRTSLGEQAQDVFQEVKLEDLLTLDNIYHISKLDDIKIDKTTRLHVSTVQGMVQRILYSSEDFKPASSDYDLIIIDEAHRGYILDKEMSEGEIVYANEEDYQSKYRKVLEYFDAKKIALTATPALHTVEIFGKPVYRYTYREAVIDGYLVDHDAPHRIETTLSQQGIIYKKGSKIKVYVKDEDKVVDLDLMEDELKFDVDKFNKQIIVPEFNKVVLEEIAQNIDPDNVEHQGKTLIYAVNDAHADMIVYILKKYYTKHGIPEEAIMKITGSVGGGNPKKVQEAIKRFKNERFPSVVVTVDLLTTGIDVPKITNLVFMRRVKSRILFEQMLGRATRLCPSIHKTHFEIYDPVGTYDSLEDMNTMKPVVTNTTATFEELVNGTEKLTDDSLEIVVKQIIAKLQRKKHNIQDEDLEQFKDLAEGMDINGAIKALKESLVKTDTEEVKTTATDDQTINCCLQTSTGNSSIKDTIAILKKALVFLDNTKGIPSKPYTVVIDDRPDTVVKVERGFGKNNCPPDDYLKEFADFIQNNQNEIAALKIVCTRPSDLTREALKSLKLALDREGFTEKQLNTAIGLKKDTEIAADIISLIRRYALGSVLLSHEERIKNAVKKLKKNNKFTAIELKWIETIQDYLLNESVMNVSVFSSDRRFKGKIQKQFEHDLGKLVTELNTYLYEDMRGAI